MGTTRLKSRRRQDQGLKWARVIMGILATIGVIDTGSITFNRWGLLGPLTCPGSSEGCDRVLNSPWGTIFQGNNFVIPLSLLGLISYLSLLVMAFLPFIPRISESKNDVSRRSWWGLFAISCSMSIFSLLLIWLMLFKIKAFCFFCILSACISFLILILSIIGGGWDDYSKLFFRGILLSLGILLGGLIWSSSIEPNKAVNAENVIGLPPSVKTISNSNQVKLAKHLKAKGVVMYSAYWCPHCHDQKEMLGKEASNTLTIIECAEDGLNNQRSLCESKGISGFPSWEINGKIDSGVKTLEELADLSNYIGSRDF